jgi:hypothetical protein
MVIVPLSHCMVRMVSFCCGRIDPTQAVKATGFNHRGHREHRVFKPILCVPLWLYSLPMLFMSIAVLCVQLTITKMKDFSIFFWLCDNPSMIDWTCPLRTDSGTADGCAAQRGLLMLVGYVGGSRSRKE